MKSFWHVLIGATVFAAGGCEREPSPPTQSTEATPPTASASDHDHGDAPHGGTLVDWGGGAYHVEFTVDHDAKSATVYILGDDAKTAAPVKAEKLLLTINEPAFQVELAANPQRDDAPGTSSRFTGTHENLGIVREFAGTISGEADGTPYSGDFAEVAGEHGHDH